MSRSRRFILAAGVVAALSLVAYILHLVPTVLAAAAVPLVLVLPGVALQRALFPRAQGSEAALLATTLGLSAVIFLGFFLNLLPGGLNAAAWVISLGILTVVALGVAAIRLPHGSSWAIVVPDHPVPLAMACAVVITGSAFLIARIGLEEQVRPGFTQLWMLPGDTPSSVTVGVRNEERTTESFALVLGVDGEPVAQWSPLVLEPSEEWVTQAIVPALEEGSAVSAQATLFRVSNLATPYRAVHVWLQP